LLQRCWDEVASLFIAKCCDDKLTNFLYPCKTRMKSSTCWITCQLQRLVISYKTYVGWSSFVILASCFHKTYLWHCRVSNLQP
jgi:hypothetical protein